MVCFYASIYSHPLSISLWVMSGKAEAGSFLEHVYGSGGNGPDADLIQSLERDCVDRCPSVTWDSRRK